MKKIITLLTITSFVSLGNITFSQTKEDYHKALTVQHTKIKENTQTIISGASKTKEEHIKHASEAMKHLESAKKEYENLKKLIPRDHTEVAMPYLTAIETYHIQAAYHANALNEELKKTSHNEAMVIEHAKNLHESIDKAEKEHQALKEKTKK
ncbi:MAG TPA: hypothetical protein VN026_05625 [Bacteroidia bacterium]|jgi:hypothetical protein|nr:hypothetical protein [Bacteroidia bacterium]